MEESDKLPLKRVELSLSKFNEVAIPHHLNLLRQHRANILKYEACGEYARVRAEQTNARRVSAQLRALLGELEALRRRVRDADLPRFDAATQRSRDLTLKAIVDYLETSPPSANGRARRECSGGRATPPPACGSAVSSDSVGVLPLEEADAETPLRLHIDDKELSIREREELLRGWSALQTEVRALHDVWQHVHAAALHHREQVSTVRSRVEEADVEVEAARAHLSVAERLRHGAVALGGACAGALAGGPAGLVLGAKAGAAAALAGSLLGYLGARALLPKRAALPAPPAPPAPTDADECGKKRE